MRGKASARRCALAGGGITPAYAGKSFEFLKKKCLPRDHPRLCGEKTTQTYFGIKYEGSPPPMRGKGYFSMAWNNIKRITPAYAGKSYISDRYRFPR